MISKADVRYLPKEELVKELTLRGVLMESLEKDVDGLRRQLKSIVTSSIGEPTIITGDDFESELTAVTKKYEEYRALVENYDGTMNSMRKISARLRHLVSCCESFNSSVASEIAKHIEIKKKSLDLLVSFEKNVRSRAITVNVVQTAIGGMLGNLEANPEAMVTLADLDEHDEEEHAGAFSTPKRAEHHHGPGPDFSSIFSNHRPGHKQVPIHKWNLKFRGDRSQSVNAFLQDVEELRVARGYTEQEVFRSAIDLFEEKAALWYRSIRKRVNTWEELKDQLLSEFLPANYHEVLLEEIKARTQGETESIGIYLAIMDGMFSLLKPSLSETEKLRILRRNILPFYQTQLGLFDVENVDRLLELCRKLEVTRLGVDSFVPPSCSKSKSVVEPYYAYSGLKSGQKSSLNSLSDNVRCWKCKEKGHLSAGCNKPRVNRCFGCGKEGFVKSSCPDCRSKLQGNGAGVQRK